MVAEYETKGCHTLAGMVISTFAKSITPGSSTVYAYHYTKFNICVHSSYLDKMYIFLRLFKFCFCNPSKLQITLWCYLYRPKECLKVALPKSFTLSRRARIYSAPSPIIPVLAQDLCFKFGIFTTTRLPPAERKIKGYNLFQSPVHYSSSTSVSSKHWFAD